MKHIKLITLSLSLLAVSLLVFSGVTSAQSVKTGETVTVAAGEKIDSLLFASGTNIDIAGTVNGDVFCAGQTVMISGTVNGDVFCAGQTVNVSGKINGSVRLAGQTVTVGGTVDGSAAITSQTLLLERTGFIRSDLIGAVQSATLNGSVSRDVAIGVSNMAINGQVGRNVKSEVETLTVGPAGRIGGDIAYISNTGAIVSPGGQIAGTLTRTPQPQESGSRSNAPFALTFSTFIYSFVTLLIMALALAVLIPGILHEVSSKALSWPGRSALTGLLGIIVVPIIILILLFSIIGLPLGILALLVWLVIVMLSGPFAGYTLGRLILKTEKNPIFIMFSGASLLLVIYFIPILGVLVMLAAYMFGTGMILNAAMHRMRREPKSVQKVF
ncbi:polymer-forming cytoskeletal protein [Candidatus Saccharibacteria bacterium]|nr:polymer-forming cytoskeletal protein [Candidatus Saccharibacteria bacterium]